MRPMMHDPLHIKMKNARLKSGMTQKEVADKMGQKVAAISHWECARREPSATHFLNYMYACGYDLTGGLNDDTV